MFRSLLITLLCFFIVIGLEANAIAIRPLEFCHFLFAQIVRRALNPIGRMRLIDSDDYEGMHIDIYQDVNGLKWYRINDGWTRGLTSRGLEELKGWFNGIHYESLRLYPDKLVDTGPLNGLRVLDVGCGGGRLVQQLRAQGVVAFGLDQYLDKEQRQCPEIFKRGLAEKLPYEDNSFDVLYYNASAFLHGSVSSKGYVQYLKEASRVLKKGGKIRIAIVDAENLSEALEELPNLSITEIPTKKGKRSYEWRGKPWTTAPPNTDWIFVELTKNGS